MQTRRGIDPLQPKTWQLDPTSNGVEGYLYYCILCDEALVLSKQQINPQKIQIIFDNKCPGCGFKLANLLGCIVSFIPQGRRLLTNLQCRDAELLLEPEDQYGYQTRRGSTLPRDLQPDLTTGIEEFDKTLVLKRGQLVWLQGEPSNALSLLLCVRATLPTPHGLDSNVVFIDSGNLFDTYTISQHTINHGLDTAKVQERIHLSRAFTHHQGYNLVTEKLLSALKSYEAGLAVISDITALFCDPDVRDRKESLGIFRRSIRVLTRTAEDRNMLIIVTNLKRRNKAMEDSLTHTAHVSAILEENSTLARLTIVRHPFIPRGVGEVTIDDPRLIGYFPKVD